MTKKNIEMLLEAAETVLGIFGVDRSMELIEVCTGI